MCAVCSVFAKMDRNFEVADRVVGRSRATLGRFGTIVGFEMSGKRPMVVVNFDDGRRKSVSRAALEKVRNLAIPAEVPIIQLPEEPVGSPRSISSDSNRMSGSSDSDVGLIGALSSELDDSDQGYVKKVHF